MYTITYSLRGEGQTAELYYKEILSFADKVLAEALEVLQEVIDSYLSYLDTEKLTKSISKEEAILELLILGVLWRVYGGDSQHLDTLPESVMIKLSDLRKNNEALKPGINVIKGVLSTLFLSPDLYDHLKIEEPGKEKLDKLLCWLSATGEFEQEVKRLRIWQRFFEQLTNNQIYNIISEAISLALWFEESSEALIGEYTGNVERFLNEFRPKHYWREDVIFCGRRRVEYHLNMVGAEIMNRAFRKAFTSTSKKLLLLPTCMRIGGSVSCAAVNNGRWFKCRKCIENCQVCQLSKQGEAQGFDVLMVAHGSSISSSSNDDVLFDSDTGVIGVSCVLNLISGGWMLKEMGIPAQCVLLDYCGCKTHWHEEGIPTQIDINKLKCILKDS